MQNSVVKVPGTVFLPFSIVRVCARETLSSISFPLKFAVRASRGRNCAGKLSFDSSSGVSRVSNSCQHHVHILWRLYEPDVEIYSEWESWKWNEVSHSCFRNDSLMLLPVIFRTFSWCIFIQANERGKFKIVWWIDINLSENYTVNDISSSL